MEYPRASLLERPRRSFALTLSPLVLARKSVSYDKLPDEPLKLSILKLDASSFGILVDRSQTTRNNNNNLFIYLFINCYYRYRSREISKHRRSENGSGRGLQSPSSRGSGESLVVINPIPHIQSPNLSNALWFKKFSIWLV